jgi:hypothetical protein
MPPSIGRVVNSTLGKWQTTLSANGLNLYIQVLKRAPSGSYITWSHFLGKQDIPWAKCRTGVKIGKTENKSKKTVTHLKNSFLYSKTHIAIMFFW